MPDAYDTEVVFNNFAQGEWGLQGSYNVGFGLYRGKLLYRGWFSGANVIRYTNGMIGPRWGELKLPANIGFGVGQIPTSGGFVPRLVGWGQAPPFANQAPGALIVYAMSTTDGNALGLWGCPVGPGVTSQAWFNVGGVGTVAALGGDPSKVVFSWVYAGGGVSYLSGCVPWAGAGWAAYKIDANFGAAQQTGGGTAATATKPGPITSGPTASVACMYSGFYCVANFSGAGVNANQLQFNGLTGVVSDPTAWGAPGFINVGGDHSYIVGLYPTRHWLGIAKDDGTWWVMTGVPGVNTTLRQITNGPVPQVGQPGAVLGGASIMFTSIDPASGSILPVEFNGSRIAPLRYLAGQVTGTPGPGQNTTSVVALADVGDWAAEVGVGATTVLRVHRQGCTSSHSMAAVRPGFWPWASWPAIDYTLYADGALNLYASRWYTERPPFTNDFPVLDPATVGFTLPEYWDRTGGGIAVRMVLVDFTKWDTGDPNPNQFTLTKTTLRQVGVPATSNPTPGPIAAGLDDPNVAVAAFSEDPGQASAAGTHQRAHFGFDATWGNGFQLSFTGLRGVAIEKVVVLLKGQGVVNI